jgi:hypothetical protein
VLGPLAAFLVVYLIPSLVGLDANCVGALGSQRLSGDTYHAGMMVLGTFGWLLVALGVLYAQIAESERLAVLLPVAWFVLLILSSLAVAAGVGPQSCPS